MQKERIMIESGKRSGQPCIRGLRITVWDVLGWLATGQSEEQIIDDYPELEKEDFLAVYDYAAGRWPRSAVKILLDENLSRKLINRIEDLFPGSRHVASEDLLQAPDKIVWEYAKSNGFAIITADVDFYEMATSLGPPPKVIWLRGCNYSTSVAERLIRGQSIRTNAFIEDRERAVLVLIHRFLIRALTRQVVDIVLSFCEAMTHACGVAVQA